MAVNLWTSDRDSAIAAQEAQKQSNPTAATTRVGMTNLFNDSIGGLASDETRRRVSYDPSTDEGQANLHNAWEQANKMAAQTMSNGNRFGNIEYNSMVDDYFNKIVGDPRAASAVRNDIASANSFAPLRTANNALSMADKGIGFVIDGIFDNTIGNLVGLFNEDAGNSVKNFMTDEEAGNLASTLGLMLVPGAGIPLAVAKTALQSEDEIASAITGKDAWSGLDLTDDERQNAALSSALNIGLTALPGIGKLGSAAKNAIVGKAGKEVASKELAAGESRKKGIANLEKDVANASDKYAKAESALQKAEESTRAARTDLRNTTGKINNPGRYKDPYLEPGKPLSGLRQGKVDALNKAKTKEAKISGSVDKAKSSLDYAQTKLDKNIDPEKLEKVARERAAEIGSRISNGGVYDRFTDSLADGDGIVKAIKNAIGGKSEFRGATDGDMVAKRIGHKIAKGDPLTEDELKYFANNGLTEYMKLDKNGTSAFTRATKATEQAAKKSAEGKKTFLGKRPKTAEERAAKNVYGKKLGSTIGTGLGARGAMGFAGGAMNGAANSNGDGTAMMTGGIEGALMGMLAPKLAMRYRGAGPGSRLTGPTRMDALTAAGLGAGLSGASHSTSGYNNVRVSQDEKASILKAIEGLFEKNEDMEE